MFNWLYNLLGTLLSWFSSITGSYAWALLLYALLFKIVFIPFSIKQQKNQIKSAKLAPKIALIKAKYKGRNDQTSMRKQQEEIMELQQREGASPLSGCLPLLLQMPIILILYNVIRKPLSFLAKLDNDVVIKLYKLVNGVDASTEVAFKSVDQIVLIGDIQKFSSDLSGSVAIANEGLTKVIADLPNFDLWGTSLAQKPYFWSWLILIPIFAAGFQWLTMFLSRKFSGNASQLQAADDAQAQMSMRMMDLTMPLMTLFFAFSFSSMMGLYWIYQSILGIIQMLILAKLMPVPKFTDDEIKEIRKAEKEQEKKQKTIMKTQPKYKSLHYIDADDYDELPEIQSNTKKDTKPLSQDKPEIKD